MKFIKTYWHNLDGPDKGDYYLRIKQHRIYMFALSSLQLLKYQPADLYTDAEGFELIKTLKIPFTKVSVVEKISFAYKSANDLYVLAMQDEPVVLMDDNLLLTGNIEINCKPSSVTVLGIDLNSLKLDGIFPGKIW